MGVLRRYGVMDVLMVLCLGLLCVGVVFGDAGVETTDTGDSSEKVAPLLQEIERLRRQVGSLDSSIEKKDAYIGVMEKELTKMLQAAHKDGSGGKLDLSKLEDELESKDVKVKELEDSLKTATKQSEQAHQYAESLKKRAELAEKTVRDLEDKYERTQKKFLESKKKVQETDKALELAEATISAAEMKLHAHGEELSRVHSLWLPPWAASHLTLLKSRVQTKWTTHAKPHVDYLYKHSSDYAASAHAYVKPHIDTVGAEAQKHWKTASDTVTPYVELIQTKTRNGYDVVTKDYYGKVQDFVQPHINTVVDTSRPYIAKVQEHTRPYVDNVATFSKPYLNQGQDFLNGHLETISPYYRNAVSAAVRHHENLQDTVRDNLSKSDFAASYISKELVWFLASALLALPVITALLVFASVFGGKKRPHSRRHSPRGSASSGTTGPKHKRAKKVDKFEKAEKLM